MCEKERWNITYDKDRKGHFGFSFSEWVCFDGVQAVQDKVNTLLLYRKKLILMSCYRKTNIRIYYFFRPITY